MKIRRFKEKDTYEAALLISQTYRKYNWDDSPIDAVKKYVNYYNPNKNLEDIRKRFMASSFFIVAENNFRIVGMLRAIENRIVNLFVHGDYHRQGIGRKLIHRYEQECKRRGYQEVVLRSSLCAIPFYQVCGYKKTTGIRRKFGLVIQPMKKALANG